MQDVNVRVHVFLFASAFLRSVSLESSALLHVKNIFDGAPLFYPLLISLLYYRVVI